MNALAHVGSTQSGKMQENNVKDKNTNRLPNTKQTALKNLRNSKKRSLGEKGSFGDVVMGNNNPSKTRRVCDVAKTKLTAIPSLSSRKPIE